MHSVKVSKTFENSRYAFDISVAYHYLFCMLHTTPLREILLAFFVLAPLLSNPGYGQVPGPGHVFRRISTDDGLSQSVVLCMAQDRRGFMWFGTEDGLNRYDGYSFVTYRYDPLDSNSLSSSYIWSLHEDRDGLLWIGTWGGGINCFDPIRNSFTRYRHDPTDTTTISHDRVTAVLEDSLGTLWACTAGGGMNRFDRTTRRFIRVPELFSTLPMPRRTALFCAVTDRDGIIWIGTYSAGLLSYDPRRGTVRDFRHKAGDDASISDDRITGLSEADNGDLWVGTWGGGLNLFHRSRSTFEHFRTDPRDSTSLPGDIVRSLFRDRKRQPLGRDNGSRCCTFRQRDTPVYPVPLFTFCLQLPLRRCRHFTFRG